jgi:hypothetical protein
MHAIAWHFEFPTAVERILWQTATVVAAGSPLVGLITIPLAQLTVPSGDSLGFMEDCLRLLREFSWHAPDEHRTLVDQAFERLEEIYMMDKTDDDSAKKLYKFIFSGPDNQSPQLGEQVFNFINNHDFKTNLHNDFAKNFKMLLDLMEERGTKRLCETARTNVFPRRNLLPKALNFCILSITSILYCLSRLSLLAIAVSSLRWMPESVYLDSSWTAYIPTFGSLS